MSVEIKNRLLGLAQWDVLAANPKVAGAILSVTRTGVGLYDVTLSAPQVWDFNDPSNNSVIPFPSLLAGGVNEEFIQCQQLVNGTVFKIITSAGGNPVDQAGVFAVYAFPTIN